MESYVRIGGRGLKNLTYAYMGVGGVKNCQNHAYVINECPFVYIRYISSQDDTNSQAKEVGFSQNTPGEKF